MAESVLITPTIRMPFDTFAALVFEEIIRSELGVMQQAVIHMDNGSSSIRVFITGATPLTFTHEIGPDEIEQIRASQIFRDAYKRSLAHFVRTGFITLQRADV